MDTTRRWGWFVSRRYSMSLSSFQIRPLTKFTKRDKSGRKLFSLKFKGTLAKSQNPVIRTQNIRRGNFGIDIKSARKPART